ITATGAAANHRIVVVLFSGVGRFLHLNANRGRFSISTDGQTRGHSCAADAFGVAATPSGPAQNNAAIGPFPGVFSSTNVVETFSSDGPRRVFFQANGTPYTPGNFSATGGTLRQKPDITAADGTSVTGVGGFSNPFFGTSAAAPHAAAIAGLIKSAGPFTNAQIRTALISTAIDIEAPGVDRDSGAGIIMALEAIKSLNVPGNAFLTLGTLTVSEVVGNGNGVIEPGETGALTIPLNNVGVVTATNVQATLSTSTPGITLIQAGPLNYGNIAADGTALNPSSYTFTVSANFPCNATVNFSLLATYGGGPSGSQALNFTQQIVGAPLVITETLNPTPPVSGAIYTATSGTQNNRLNRNGIISSCAAPKTTPLLQEAGVGLARRFDSFTLTNPSPSTNCITVTLSSACNAAAGSQLYLAAYNNSGFVPTAIQTNYLADRGVTTLGNQTISFNVPGNANFTLVVHEITSGATNTNACPYTLTISGLTCPAGPVCAPITVNPASLSNGTIGTPYNATVTASSTVALPYVYTVSEGVLPPGLSLNSATGAISGTPNTTGIFNFRVTATSGACSGFRDYSITVACPTTSLTPGTLPAGTAGNAYSQTLSVTPAGTYTYSLTGGSLPSGFTLNPGTGVISGLTSATGSYQFTVAAQTSNGCGTTGVYTLAIGCPTVTVNPASLPNGTVGSAYSQTLSAAPAGGNYSYAVTAGALPTGLSLNSATGVLSGTPTANGTFNFTVTVTGFGSCSGNRAYTMTIGTGGCPTITLPDSLPNGSVGTLYSNSAAASPSGSYTYSATGSLPPGTTLYTSIGLIFGYPTAAGSYTFTITATAGACSGSKQYTVVIGAGFASSLTVFSDFDGDGKSDLSVFRGTDGSWLVANSGNGQLQSTPWGSSAAPYYDLAVSGDYDGDGKTDQAVFRRGTDLAGYWFIKRSSDGQVMRQHWGLGTDVPVAGDYDGDGKTDIAVWRGSAGAWYILRSSDGGVEGITWGIASVGDIPVPGDYDGDFKTDVAVFRRGIQGQQGGDWHIKRSSDGSTLSVKWGVGTDVPVAGDYDGDGKTDLAVWRATEGNWYVVQSSNAMMVARSWATGSQGDVPVPGDFDGDGKADFAVWNEPTGTWLVNRSHDNSTVTKGHGQIGDVPILARRN
ncbi:MAG TPA: putative Ig domain-containing protein, partial [Blastocatellia bacterium]